jgi:aminoglycoside 2'-N-acetyltransferase I
MGEAIELRLAHTSDLDLATLEAARALLYEVFGAEMTDQDWEHALGGVHALALERGRLVGHASVVQRRLIYRDRALRTGYVEGVAVRADRRRVGFGGAMMAEIERVIRTAYELGALGASDAGAAFYAARGWRRWRGQTWALTPHGRVRTAGEDDSVFVLEGTVALDLSEALTCDWRDGELW